MVLFAANSASLVRADGAWPERNVAPCIFSVKMAQRSSNSSRDPSFRIRPDDDDGSGSGEDRAAVNGTPSGPKIRSRAIDVNQPLVVMFPEDETVFDGYFVHVEGFASTERPTRVRGSVRVPLFQAKLPFVT